MEFRDLKKQYAVLKNDIDRHIDEVIASSRFIGGRKVSELEEKLAAYVGTKHCVTCANGTDALELALMAWGIGKGDAVFVPDFTFFSSGEIVAILGATPVFVDVDEDTFNMNSVSLEKAINEVIADGELKPRVVIPVDLFGLPANFVKIRKIADKYGLKILEDGAQASEARSTARERAALEISQRLRSSRQSHSVATETGVQSLQTMMKQQNSSGHTVCTERAR